ncbi:MAG: redoxin domain-containing protein [Chitinophagaceae bacterium]|nr:redoxin domain-containing protein [Chitinophagaceae bacterium]
MLPIGSIAPGFELYSSPDQRISLDEWRGKKVILVFYPADWSPVCGSQMNLYNEMEEYFTRYNAQLLGISVDSRWCHAAYGEQNGFYFPLLADFEPKGEVSRLYEAYDEETGECCRALYVIDEDGVIIWNYLSPINVNPGADGILQALEKSETLKTIEL